MVRTWRAHAPYLLKKVEDGEGTHTFSWEPLISSRSYHPFPFHRSGESGLNDLTRGMWVVAQYDTSAPHLGTATETYEYSFGEVDLRGRGFRGFKIITHKNLATGTEDTTNFEVVGDGTTRPTSRTATAVLPMDRATPRETPTSGTGSLCVIGSLFQGRVRTG